MVMTVRVAESDAELRRISAVLRQLRETRVGATRQALGRAHLTKTLVYAAALADTTGMSLPLSARRAGSGSDRGPS
jgi:hypothetical protein